MKKGKRLQSYPNWYRWVRDSLTRGQDARIIYEILLRNHFLPSSIRRVMAEVAPAAMADFQVGSNEQKSIYVALAALNEEYLEFTLDGLFSNAKNPELIIVGLVDQTNDDNRSWLAKKSYWDQIRYVALHPQDSQGLSWARSVTFSLYQGEDYLLQIDAHTLFEPEWDARLIRAYQELEALAPKPVLSTYPPAFEFNDQNEPFKVNLPQDYSDQVLVIKRKMDDPITKDSLSWRFQGHYVNSLEPIEGFAISGGFLFAHGFFVDEIPYDAAMYFQDEKNVALRAFTHGWSIYHPSCQNIPLHHLYRKPDDGRSASLHWNPEDDRKRKVKSGELILASTLRMVDIISGRVVGAYGLGQKRSLEEFCEFSQIPYDKVYKE